MALKAIAGLYPSDSYAVIPQVPDTTGFDKRRTADALAFQLWPSRGLTIEGIEIKASRSDLVKELRQPAKTEGMARFCHYWSVAAMEGVCDDADELPKPWGLIVWTADGEARRVKMPKTLENKPKHDMGFICGLARAIHAECWSPADIEAIKAAEHQRGFESGQRTRTVTDSYEFERLKELREKAIKFSEVTGVDLVNDWNGGQVIGEAYKLALTLVNDYHRKLAPLKLMIEAIEKELGGLTPQVVEPLPLPKRRKARHA